MIYNLLLFNGRRLFLRSTRLHSTSYMSRSIISPQVSSCYVSNKNSFVTNWILCRNVSSKETPSKNTDLSCENLSNKEKIKRAVSAYGGTVIVFHTAIALTSLGICYSIVASGVDLKAALEYLDLTDGLSHKITTNAGTFVIAYAIHKLFLPVRVGITLTATPFIVKYLRKIGILKNPKKMN